MAEKRRAVEVGEDESQPDARFEERTTKQYAKRQNGETLASTRGNPNLVYESRLIHSFEPTGVPVSEMPA
jgi:catechol O-methyltransferase